MAFPPFRRDMAMFTFLRRTTPHGLHRNEAKNSTSREGSELLIYPSVAPGDEEME
jgi:hypothetical protein